MGEKHNPAQHIRRFQVDAGPGRDVLLPCRPGCGQVQIRQGGPFGAGGDGRRLLLGKRFTASGLIGVKVIEGHDGFRAKYRHLADLDRKGFACIGGHGRIGTPGNVNLHIAGGGELCQIDDKRRVDQCVHRVVCIYGGPLLLVIRQPDLQRAGEMGGIGLVSRREEDHAPELGPFAQVDGRPGRRGRIHDTFIKGCAPARIQVVVAEPI